MMGGFLVEDTSGFLVEEISRFFVKEPEEPAYLLVVLELDFLLLLLLLRSLETLNTAFSLSM